MKTFQAKIIFYDLEGSTTEWMLVRANDKEEARNKILSTYSGTNYPPGDVIIFDTIE